MVQRQRQPGSQIDCRLPSEKLPGLRDIRTALLGVIHRQRLEDDGAARSGHLQNDRSTLEDRKLRWVTNVHRRVLLRARKPQNALDLVADIAEAARLRAIAKD